MLMEKIESAFKSNFLSDISFTEDEIDEMKLHLMDAVDNFNNRGIKYFYQDELKEFILLIVYYAQNWGDGEESKFWVRILGNIFETYTFNVNNKFYDEVEKIFNRYNLILFRSDSGKRMVRETLLFHALAPKVSVQAFIRLLFNYCIDDNSINRTFLTDKDTHRRIAKGLEKRFNNTQTSEMEQDIIFDGNTYAIRSGIKYACKQNKELIVLLISNIMDCFNSILCDEQDIEESPISSLVEEVIKQIFAQDTKTKNKRKISLNNEPVVSDFSKIYSYYEIINNEPYISLPEVRIFDDEMKNVEVSLLNNGSIIASNIYDIIGRDFKKKIKKISIPLLLGENRIIDIFRYQVIVKIDDEVVYDSKESLFRKYILLTESREIKKDCKPGTYYLLYPDNFKVDGLDCAVQGIKRNFASITSSENDYIAYKDKIIFFNSKKQDSHIIVNGIEIENARFNTSENEFRVFNNVESITLLLNNSSPNTIMYKVNNNNPLALINKNVTVNDNQYTINLSGQLASLNQITFYDLKNNLKTIECVEFAIFDKLKVLFDKPYYFGQITGQLSIIDDENEIFNSVITGEDDSISLEYGNGSLNILCPNIKFQIDNKDWRSQPISKPVWYKNLHSGSILKIHNNSALNISIKNGDKDVRQLDDAFLIGDCITSHGKEDVDINLIVDNNAINLLKILFFEKLYKEPELMLEEGFIIHDISSKFIGDIDSRFLLVLTGEDEKEYKFSFLPDDLIDAKGISEGYYVVEVYLLRDTLYGDEKKLLYSSYDDMLPLGNVMKFEFNNAFLVIQNAKVPLGRVRFDNTYIDNILYIEEDFYPLYKGTLHVSRKSIPVEFERKDEKTIKIYVNEANTLKLINIDYKEKSFTLNMHDDKNIFECFSCFYRKEIK